MPFITLRLKAEVVVKSQKLKQTIWALRSSEAIAKQYLDLQKLPEEVRRTEIGFGIRTHSPKCGTRSRH